MTVVEGVGPDAEVVVNDKGGKQSKTLYALTLIDPRAMFRLGQVLRYGADKYGRDNWRAIGWEDHLNHALIHAYAYLAGDRQDDHLGHMLARVMMAVATEEETGNTTQGVCSCREGSTRQSAA